MERHEVAFLLDTFCSLLLPSLFDVPARQQAHTCFLGYPEPFPAALAPFQGDS